MSEQVQVLGIEPRTSKPKEPGGVGRPYKVVRLSDGREASCWQVLDGLAAGAFGIPKFKEYVRDGKIGHELVGWTQTKPPGERPPTVYKDSPPIEVEQAKWDAKDRGMDMESAAKSWCGVVGALVQSGGLKTVDEALTALLAGTAAIYEQCQLARADRIATKANIFAEE